MRFFHSPLFRLPLAYGEVEGEWEPEEEVKVEVEKPEPITKKTYSFNTDLYNMIDAADSQEEGEEMEEDTTLLDKDYDDWTNFPTSKDSS